MKNFLGVEELGEKGIVEILNKAEEFFPYALQRRRYASLEPNIDIPPEVFNLFLEDSLRTWGSFRSASRFLGFGFRLIKESHTSLSKGETFASTVRMLTLQQGADILVMRTKYEGGAMFASRIILSSGLNVPVINAGDGSNYHPTQTFLDLLAIRRKLGRLDNFTMALCGDVLHSRVAHGLFDAARMFGFKIGIFSPPESRPPRYWLKGVHIVFESDSRDDLRQCDILYVFRLQKERISDPVEQKRRLAHFAINPQILDDNCQKEIYVMHAQPIDYDDGMIQLYPGIFRDPRYGFIQEQACCAVPVRMAVLLSAYNNRDTADLIEDSVSLEPEVMREESIESHFKTLSERRAEIIKPTR